MNDGFADKRVALLNYQQSGRKKKLFDYFRNHYSSDDVHFRTLHVNIYDRFNTADRDLTGIKTTEERIEEIKELTEIAGDTQINELSDHFDISKDKKVVPHGHTAMDIKDKFGYEGLKTPLMTERYHDGFGCHYDMLVVEDTIPAIDYKYDGDVKATDYTIDYSEKEIEGKRAVYIRDSDTHRTSYFLVGKISEFSNEEFMPYWLITPAEHVDYFFKRFVTMEPLKEEEMKEKLKWNNVIKNLFGTVDEEECVIEPQISL